jgi:hypothetical protein
MFKFQELFARWKCVKFVWHLNKSCGLQYKKLKIKNSYYILAWFEIMIIFQDETYNLLEFVHFSKIQIYSKRVNTSNLLGES